MKRFKGRSLVEFTFSILLQVYLASCQDSKKCECGQKEFYDPEATIQSPNFPDIYPNDCNCAYRIFTDRMVEAKFEVFAIEESDDCKYDYLNVVFEATSPNAKPERYCGEGLSKVDGGEISGKGPLIMAFKSDEADSLQGFRFTYKFLLHGADPCLSDPCTNGGTCKTMPGYYLCDCVAGYVGANCEIDKDDCLSYPCQNNGQCIDAVDSFSCECVNGYTGDVCEVVPKLCVSEPCQNGGLCVERGYDYVCSCPRDFMGTHCETPVPTPPPRITTTIPTTTITTTAYLTSSSAKASSNSSLNHDDDVKDEDSALNPSSTSKPSDDSDEDLKSNQEDNSFIYIIAIVVIAILLLLLFGLAWYCWKRKKLGSLNLTNKENNSEKKRRKSKSGKGKKKRRLSRTTSFKSVMMKSAGQEKVTAKMSEDIIVEEVTDDAQSLATKLHPVTAVDLNAGNRSQEAQKNPQRNGMNSFKNTSFNKTQPNPGIDHNLTNFSDYQAGQQNAPYHLSPDDAVNLFNQMKQNKLNNPSDYNSTLDQYGLATFPKNPFPNMSSMMGNNNSSSNPMTNNLTYGLPNVPFDQNLNKKSQKGWNMNLKNNKETMELSPEEAAEVVNCLLQYESPGNAEINKNDAMNIIREVKNKRESGKSPKFERERSIVVHPLEVVDLVNHYSSVHQNKLISSEGQGNGSLITSTYDPSESGDRYPLRMNRDFRAEYSPIQEESKAEQDEMNLQIPKQKRPSQTHGQIIDEPDLKRLRKKPKHFPYERTLDPDEKVHDWLKNTPKQKMKHQDSGLATEPTDPKPQTVITRPMPSKSQDDMNRNPKNSVDKIDNTPRTIRQTRNNQSSFKITENKAMSLVDKLLKPPAKSNHNVVGPGLAMSRENAFVGDNF